MLLDAGGGNVATLALVQLQGFLPSGTSPLVITEGGVGAAEIDQDIGFFVGVTALTEQCECTNYKPGPPGQHPVRLTRTDAITLAGLVLAAAADTFHPLRCGMLRAGEATAVLGALEQVDTALAQVRSLALADLVDELTYPADDDTDPDDTDPGQHTRPAAE